MFLLSGDVLLHRFEIRLAHGKIRVAALPFEVGVIATALLQPEIRDAFQFLHPFRLRDGAPKSREQMDMIFHAADLDGRTIELFGNAAEIRVQARRAWVCRAAKGDGLWWKRRDECKRRKGIVAWRKMTNCPGILQSQQGIAASSPRLPRVFGATLGHDAEIGIQPQRGCGKCRARRTNGMAATALRLGIFADADPG